MRHIIRLMSFTFKQLYFGMFELFVMSGQIKKILTGQVYKRISGQLKENMQMEIDEALKDLDRAYSSKLKDKDLYAQDIVKECIK